MNNILIVKMFQECERQADLGLEEKPNFLEHMWPILSPKKAVGGLEGLPQIGTAQHILGTEVSTIVRRNSR